MSAKPFRITPTPAPAGHTDGEIATRDARDYGLIDRDRSVMPTDVSPPRPPAVADKNRPMAKPFRVQ